MKRMIRFFVLVGIISVVIACGMVISQMNKKGVESSDEFTEWRLDEENTQDGVIVFQNGIEVNLPSQWIGQVIINIENDEEKTTRVSFYEKQNVNAGEDGYLFSLNFYEKGYVEPKFLIFINEPVLGVYKNSKTEYALVMRMNREGGVYNENDEKLTAAYRTLYDSINEIYIDTGKMNDFKSCGIEEIAWMGYID